MSPIVMPIAYALLIWWLSTGVIFYAIGLHRRTHGVSLTIAGVLALAALALLWQTRNGSTVWDAYAAFTGALVVWGFVEMTFLTGRITGPRTGPCPAGSSEWRRARYATETIIHHEFALVGAGLAITAATWDGGNTIALATFAVLWVMRLSSKLNLFLGVRTLNDELLPPPLAHLRTYFRRAPMNPLFPFSIIGSAAVTALLAASAFREGASDFEVAGSMLVAALLALALLEHALMMAPISVARLWGLTPEPHAVLATDEAVASPQTVRAKT